MIGSYRDWLKQQNRNVSVDLSIGTLQSGLRPLIVSPGAAYTIYIQRIICYVTTSAAQSATFQDSNTPPLVLVTIAANPALGNQDFDDYGDEGFPLGLGQGLNLNLSGGGLGLNIAIEAFAKIPLGAVVTPAQL